MHNFGAANNISQHQTFLFVVSMYIFCSGKMYFEVATHNFGAAIQYFGAAMHILEWQDIFRSGNVYFGVAMQTFFSGNTYFRVSPYISEWLFFLVWTYL